LEFSPGPSGPFSFGALRMTIVVTLGPEHNRRGRWTAYLGDRAICTTAQPLLDVAAVLLTEGADPGVSIVLMRGDVECLRSTIGTAARLTVVNDRFVRRPPAEFAMKFQIPLHPPVLARTAILRRP
jgi:hypothetical protein